MATDEEVINQIVDLILDAYNPRETRKIVKDKFPDYDDNNKLKSLIPRILKKFDSKKRQTLKKTQFLKYFLIGRDILKKTP